MPQEGARLSLLCQPRGEAPRYASGKCPRQEEEARGRDGGHPCTGARLALQLEGCET